MALLVSDWLQIGLNLAISELYPVFSSRCTYQVCYILRKTPRASSKKIIPKLSRWGRQLSIISGNLAVNPNFDLACFRGISGKTCPKQARGLCLRRSTFVCAAPSLLFTAPSLTSTTLFRCGLASCCKHLKQLSECDIVFRITFPPELVTPRSRNAFSEISEPREEVGACYERGSCQVAGPDNLSHYCRREA